MNDLQTSDPRTSDLQASDFRASLRGLWLPLVTPFRDGALDEASLRRLVRHYDAQAVDGLVLAATTGEGLTLARERNRTAGAHGARTKPARRKIFRFSSACPAATRARSRTRSTKPPAGRSTAI